MSPEAVTHSLDEICGEFLHIEEHEIITDAANNGSRYLYLIENGAGIVELGFYTIYKFMCIY